MSIGSLTGCVSRIYKIFRAPLLGAASLWLMGAGPAFAIPSPELVVGSFVSISQLFALASAILGGGAAYATVRVRSRAGSERLSRSLTFATIGMFVLLCASVGVGIYQYLAGAEAKQARLEATLTRPMPTSAGHSLDPTLKEVTYAEQLNNPRGISSEDLEKLLEAKGNGERSETFLLDIRESAETEMGTMAGAKAVRFPDIKSANIDFKGKTAILFCHNGNRSYETCQALAAMGIDCRFLIGGLEKWLVERRPLSGKNARTLSDLRAVPPFRNQRVLLDTPEVHSLVAKEGAVFVDPRYPGEFASDHLADAINLPIRPTPTAELKAKIAALPHKPIIVPCYDRRSCFFGEVLGLELDRAGFDFRGRYTLPFEYFISPAPRPYIKQWLVEARKGWFAKAADVLASLLAELADRVGVIFTILLLACASRLLVLPFSLKAERDQLRSRAVSAEFAEIKRRFDADPVRKSRAVRSFYKRHGMTPGRNLLAILFVPIMAVAVLAVQVFTTKENVSLPWVHNLSLRDPFLILPAIFGVLITTYLDLAFAKKPVHRLAIWVSALPLLVAIAAIPGAGVDIYLITSAALLVLQRLWVGGQLKHIWRAAHRIGLSQNQIALDDVSRLEASGNKAYRLAQMRSAGMPVPDGMLLTGEFLSQLAASPDAIRRRQLDRLWRKFDGGLVAVRSAATSEDGANHSFAGVFESVINVDRGGLEAAIAQVKASFEAARVSSYLMYAGVGNVLVQQMVKAEYSGVLFTRDPSAGALAMVEMVKGTAQDLVAGAVRPLTFRFGRITKKLFGESQPPIDLAPLLALGDRAERLFGVAQDMEWAYWDGRFYLVQSRDITRNLTTNPEPLVIQDEYARIIDATKFAEPGEVVFGKSELSELLPRPTPLSFSLMEALWASGGSVDLATRQLGLSYAVEEDTNYLFTILGRLYVNKRQEKSRALTIGPYAARRLMRQAGRIERDFREHFLPQFLGEMRPMAAVDFDKLSTSELTAEIKRLYDRFVFDTHVMVDVVNISASYYLDRARRSLGAEGRDPSHFLGHIPETFENHALAEIASTLDKSKRWLMLKHFGHRAVFDYELADPRYSEDLQTLNRIITGRASVPRSTPNDSVVLNGPLAKQVAIAQRFQTLKEDAKHHSLCELAILRRAVLALDHRFGFDRCIFYLAFDELMTLAGSNAAKLRDIAKSRQSTAATLLARPSLPLNLSAADIEAASAGVGQEASSAPGAVRGTRVAGSKEVVGRALVITDVDAEQGKSLDGFRDGDIIVAGMISPTWLPYFSRAGGFVSEVGGWLSHPAILAREFDVAMIVGTENIGRITDGVLLQIHVDGSVEILGEERIVDGVAAA